MSTKKLSVLHFVQDKQTGKFQVIGIYRVIGHTHLGNEKDYETIVLDEGSDYWCVRATLVKLAAANNVEPFDMVSPRLEEALALAKNGLMKNEELS